MCRSRRFFIVVIKTIKRNKRETGRAKSALTIIMTHIASEKEGKAGAGGAIIVGGVAMKERGQLMLACPRFWRS